MAIKINLMPKKEQDVSGGEAGRPFYFSIVLVIFAISSLAYLGIYSYNTFFLKKQLGAAEKKNADIQREIDNSATAEDLSATIVAITKGKSVRSILSAHYYGSNIYELLEKLSIKNISYNKFSQKIIGDNAIDVSVSGEADSYNTLAKQLIVFKKSKEIKGIVFKEASMGKDAKVPFSVILTFDQNIIAARPIITLLGYSPIEINVGSSYSDAGAVAIDGIEGALPVTMAGTVDASVAGTYTLIYKAVNAVGNSAMLTRTVNVIEPKAQ